MTDVRLMTFNPPNWQQGQKQAVLTETPRLLDPVISRDNYFEFKLPGTGDAILFDKACGFIVNFQFQMKSKKEDPDTLYTSIPKSENTKVMVRQNYFEHLIKKIDIYSGNTEISPHDISYQLIPYLNTFLYANMNSHEMDYLCVEDFHPCRAVTRKANGWTFADNSDWRTYSEKIFGPGTTKLAFRYIPLFTFPFMQGPNLAHDSPVAIPVLPNQASNFTIRLSLNQDTSGIFKKADDTTATVYRLHINSIKLAFKELKLSNTGQSKFLKHSGLHHYKGMTLFSSYDNIPKDVFNYRVKLVETLLPEAIIILALNKRVMANTFEFKDQLDDSFFLPHRIRSVNLTFGGQNYGFLKPNMGDIEDKLIELDTFFKYRENPPFKIPLDENVTKYHKLTSGCKNTIFPHLYFDLTSRENNGIGRKMPVTDVSNGTLMNKKNTLELFLNFEETGAIEDATFFTILYFSDCNLILDLKSKMFYPYYTTMKKAI